jgi:hypothetical protein
MHTYQVRFDQTATAAVPGIEPRFRLSITRCDGDDTRIGEQSDLTKDECAYALVYYLNTEGAAIDRMFGQSAGNFPGIFMTIALADEDAARLGYPPQQNCIDSRRQGVQGCRIISPVKALF